jgi:hypothetical protein
LTARPPASVRSTRRTEARLGELPDAERATRPRHRRFFGSPDTLSTEILWRPSCRRLVPVPRAVPFPVA